MWRMPGQGSRAESEMAEMACEEAATRMVAIGEWFAARLAGHQKRVLADIQAISDKALSDAEAKKVKTCQWLGLGARSSDDARAIVCKVVEAEIEAIIGAARDEMGVVLAISKAFHKLDEAGLRNVLERISGRLSKSLDPPVLQAAASQAACDITAALAKAAMRAR